MVLVETARDGFQLLTLDGKAGPCHGIHYALQGGAAGGGVGGGAEPCQLGGRVGVVAAAYQQSICVDLEVETHAFLACGKCSLGSLVRRLVQRETDVPVGSEELGRSELGLQLGEQEGERPLDRGFIRGLVSSHQSRLLLSSSCA